MQSPELSGRPIHEGVDACNPCASFLRVSGIHRSDALNRSLEERKALLILNRAMLIAPPKILRELLECVAI